MADHKFEQQEDGSIKITFNGDEGITMEELREKYMVERKPGVYDFVLPKD